MTYILLYEIKKCLDEKEVFSSSIQDYINQHKSEHAVLQSQLAFQLIKKYALLYFQIDINQEELLINEHRKPSFSSLKFNISHSKNYLAIGISDREIGVDIQEVKEISRPLSLAKKIMTPSELTRYMKNPTFKELMSVFSQKEAYFKFLGTGFERSSFQMKVPLVENIDVYDSHHQLYVLSICSEDYIKKVIHCE